jgi:pimeloyl-ACP methyl ester carboxylesterase
MNESPAGASIPGVSHHRIATDGTELHYVAAGDSGSPVLLVHGFPETWWAFRSVIPALARTHRVFALDLRGFGDSANGPGAYDAAASAADLAALVEELGLGPVHLTGQDISGGATFRFAAAHPEAVRSWTGIETGLAGFGVEALADVTHGGAWHIGVLAAPGIPEMLLAGRERELIADYAFPSMVARSEAITGEDVDELVRAYSRPDGFRGAAGLYRAMLEEGEEIRALAAERPLPMPVMAVGAASGEFTLGTLGQVSAGPVRSELIAGAGHYVALEAPDELSRVLLEFFAAVDADRDRG